MHHHSAAIASCFCCLSGASQPPTLKSASEFHSVIDHPRSFAGSIAATAAHTTSADASCAAASPRTNCSVLASRTAP